MYWAHHREFQMKINQDFCKSVNLKAVKLLEFFSDPSRHIR